MLCSLVVSGPSKAKVHCEIALLKASSMWLLTAGKFRSCTGNSIAEKAKSKGKKRILVLMSDTGGGHRASAEAIKSGFQILYGNQYHVSKRLICMPLTHMRA